MDVYNLFHFKWACYRTDRDEVVIRPMCRDHEDAEVSTKKSGGEIIVVCAASGEHWVNACPVEAFEEEGEEARRWFVNLHSPAEDA